MEECAEEIWHKKFSAMKKAVFLCCICLSRAMVFGVIPLSPTQERVLALTHQVGRASPAEMQKMLGVDHEREETLTLLREVAQYKVREFERGPNRSTSVSNGLALTVLLQVGDVETIDAFGKQLVKFEAAGPYGALDSLLYREPEFAKQPKLLPYLAQTLFLPGDTNPDAILKDLPTNRSIQALFTILGVVRTVDEFSPEVKAWAETVFDNDIDEAISREVGRKWWKDNEKAFLAEDYRAVRPGLSAREIQTARTTPNSAASPSNPTATPMPAANDGPKPKPTAERNVSWPWIAGIVAMIIVALLLKRRV